MSVSSIGGSAGWIPSPTSVGRTAAAPSATPLAGHLFRPNDPLNRYLTDADRAAIKSATNVDIRANGSILSPMSMSPNDYGAVLQATGRLAADRANGSSFPLTAGSLAELLSAFGFVGTPSDAEDATARMRIDSLA